MITLIHTSWFILLYNGGWLILSVLIKKVVRKHRFVYLDKCHILCFIWHFKQLWQAKIKQQRKVNEERSILFEWETTPFQLIQLNKEGATCKSIVDKDRRCCHLWMDIINLKLNYPSRVLHFQHSIVSYSVEYNFWGI